MSEIYSYVMEFMFGQVDRDKIANPELLWLKSLMLVYIKISQDILTIPALFQAGNFFIFPQITLHLGNEGELNGGFNQTAR